MNSYLSSNFAKPLHPDEDPLKTSCLGNSLACLSGLHLISIESE